MLNDYSSSAFDSSKSDQQSEETVLDQSSDESASVEAEVSHRAQIEALQSEIASLKEQLLRTLAEAENTRKRTFKEKEESVKYAVHGFARELLAVADNLARALKTSDGKIFEAPEIAALVEGVGMTQRELHKIFEKHHIAAVAPKIGDPFDHNKHQAMFEVETDHYPAGSIAEVMQDGYTIYDRLLRPALVGVAKSKAQTPHSVDESV